MNGSLPPGAKLPSIRFCSHDLNVSSNTVEKAYGQLASEGYIEAHPQSGYLVNALDAPADPDEPPSASYLSDLEKLKGLQARLHGWRELRYDFSYGNADPSTFPLSQWLRATRDAFYGEDGTKACRYNDRQGLEALRVQIASFATREFGAAVIPEQVVVMPTVRASIDSVLRLFDPATDRIAMEDPGFPEARNAFSSRGFQTVPWRVYGEGAYDLAALDAARPRLVYLTPDNQFPTNHIMPVGLRRQLVRWARDNDAYLIEDNYCHEFRYGVDRQPSLRALDGSGRVITVGTFSKSLSPAACLGYAVLPPDLMLAWLDPANDGHSKVPWQTQATLARLMESGYWDGHLRRMQTSCRNKHREVTRAIARCMGSRVEVLDYRAGLHLLIRTKDGRDERTLIEKAAARDVSVYPTSQYWMGPRPAAWNFVLLGFSCIAAADIAPGIEALARAWFG